MAAGPIPSTHSPGPIHRSIAAEPLRPRLATIIDWPRWTRLIDRKRRSLTTPRLWPGWVYRQSTQSSFCLEGIEVTDGDIAAAVAARTLRSRHARRLRAHLAVLRRLDRCRRDRAGLSAGDVVRWYAAVSSGLNTAGPADANGERLAAVVRRVNSPHRRLQPAVTDIARVHADLLAEPIFPGFNGIVARLLLHVHLTASGLPPVVLDPTADAWPDPTPATIAATLLTRIDQALDRLLVPSPGTPGEG